MDAHVAFFNELSKALFGALKQVCELNIRLSQSLLEESTLVGQQLITQQHPAEALSAISARAQPTADKLRTYHQQWSRIAADAQVELARVTDQHVSATSLTAKALADEVQRAAAEETDRGIFAQQEAMRKFNDPFQSGTGLRGNGNSSAHAGESHMGNPGSMQSAPQAAPASQVPVTSNMLKETE
ncbi:MAG: phasin family protein [Massilia sp.]|nr:phasin family protein [Massilia sp.]